MKKLFLEPEAEIIRFDEEDIITTSAVEDFEGGNVGDWE